MPCGKKRKRAKMNTHKKEKRDSEKIAIKKKNK